MEAKNNLYDNLMNLERERKLSAIDPVTLAARLLALLSPLQKEMAAARFGVEGQLPQTLQQIGEKHNKTRERARQIINSAILVIKKAKIAEYQEFLELVHGVMQDAGGFLPEASLLAKLAHNHPSTERLNNLKFLLELDDLVRVEKAGKVVASWALQSAPHELVAPVCAALEEILEKEGKLVHEDQLLEKIKNHPTYLKNKHLISEAFVKTAMPACARVSVGLGGKYGLSQWREVTPKSLKDKVYWILQRAGKPMHYKEIAEAVQKEKFAKEKKFTLQALHNELIADQRMVLIGRGIYALAEWGFRPGTVADVIRYVLRQAGKPLSENEIVAGVMAQRQVKKTTILLNLREKDNFVKLPDGNYVVAIPKKVRAAKIAK